MGILDFPRPCNCGDNEACTHCFVNSTMFSLINEAWDYNWKSLSDKDIMSSIDNFWKSVPREKKTLIISKLKTSVSEENRHEFLIRNSLSEENRKFLIDNFNCTLESDKFVFYQNKKANWIKDHKSLPLKDSLFYEIDPAPLFRKNFFWSMLQKKCNCLSRQPATTKQL